MLASKLTGFVVIGDQIAVHILRLHQTDKAEVSWEAHIEPNELMETKASAAWICHEEQNN